MIILYFSLRYDSKGNYLDSLPDLLEARYWHACTTFTSSSGEEVWFQNLYHFFIFPQGLLVAGGDNGGVGGLLSSTELYLPSKKQWTRGGYLRRHSIKILSIIIIILMMIKSSSRRCWWFLLLIQLRTGILLHSADLFGRFLCFCQLYFVVSTKMRNVKYTVRKSALYLHVCIVIYLSTFHVINTI